jgi:hypothetical protein
MPITQTRIQGLLSVIENIQTRIGHLQHVIQARAQDARMQAANNANNASDASDGNNANNTPSQNVILDLYNAINQLEDLIVNWEFLSREDFEIFTREKVHFEFAHKRNDYSRRYMQKRRMTLKGSDQ